MEPVEHVMAEAREVEQLAPVVNAIEEEDDCLLIGTREGANEWSQVKKIKLEAGATSIVTFPLATANLGGQSHTSTREGERYSIVMQGMKVKEEPSKESVP